MEYGLDLDWCMAGCGRHTLNGALYCSSTCLEHESTPAHSHFDYAHSSDFYSQHSHSSSASSTSSTSSGSSAQRISNPTVSSILAPARSPSPPAFSTIHTRSTQMHNHNHHPSATRSSNHSNQTTTYNMLASNRSPSPHSARSTLIPWGTWDS